MANKLSQVLGNIEEMAIDVFTNAKGELAIRQNVRNSLKADLTDAFAEFLVEALPNAVVKKVKGGVGIGIINENSGDHNLNITVVIDPVFKGLDYELDLEADLYAEEEAEKLEKAKKKTEKKSKK